MSVPSVEDVTVPGSSAFGRRCCGCGFLALSQSVQAAVESMVDHLRHAHIPAGESQRRAEYREVQHVRADGVVVVLVTTVTPEGERRAIACRG